MAKFCVECGDQLNDSVRFCGSCGTAVLSLCPTCGQEWDQVPAKAPTEKQAPAAKVPIEKQAPAAKVPIEKQAPAAKAAIPVTAAQRSFPETSARVQPIYGPSFDPAKDCPNCGAKGMGSKTCTTCESEN